MKVEHTVYGGDLDALINSKKSSFTLYRDFIGNVLGHLFLRICEKIATLMLSEVPSMWPKGYTPLSAPLDEDIDALDSTSGHTGNIISLAQQQPSRLTTSAASSSFFRRQGGFGEGGQGLVKGLRVLVGEEREEMAPFDRELPHVLGEMLATDKGIDMALEHFRRLVVRLEGKATRGEAHLAKQQRRFDELARTRAQLAERAERPLDLGPALWHAKLTEDLQVFFFYFLFLCRCVVARLAHRGLPGTHSQKYSL